MTEETEVSKARALLRWIIASPSEVPANAQREAAELIERFTGNEGWLEFVRRQEAIVLDPRATAAEQRTAFLELVRFIERFAGG